MVSQEFVCFPAKERKSGEKVFHKVPERIYKFLQRFENFSFRENFSSGFLAKNRFSLSFHWTQRNCRGLAANIFKFSSPLDCATCDGRDFFTKSFHIYTKSHATWKVKGKSSSLGFGADCQVQTFAENDFVERETFAAAKTSRRGSFYFRYYLRVTKRDIV